MKRVILIVLVIASAMMYSCKKNADTRLEDNKNDITTPKEEIKQDSTPVDGTIIEKE